MEERETIKITTPVDKHEVVLKAWITGREKRELRKPFLDAMKFSAGENVPKIDEIKAGELMDKAENLAIETIVVSVNGSSENVLEKILDMKADDYDFVITEIRKITEEVGFLKPGQTPGVGIGSAR